VLWVFWCDPLRQPSFAKGFAGGESARRGSAPPRQASRRRVAKAQKIIILNLLKEDHHVQKIEDPLWQIDLFNLFWFFIKPGR